MISPSWRRCAREMMMCDHHVGRYCWCSGQQLSFQTQAGRKLESGALCCSCLPSRGRGWGCMGRDEKHWIQHLEFRSSEIALPAIIRYLERFPRLCLRLRH